MQATSHRVPVRRPKDIPVLRRRAFGVFVKRVIGDRGISFAWQATQERIKGMETDERGVPLAVLRRLEERLGLSDWPRPELDRSQLSTLANYPPSSISPPTFVWLYCLVPRRGWPALEKALGLLPVFECLKQQAAWEERAAFAGGRLGPALAFKAAWQQEFGKHLKPLVTVLRASGLADSTREDVAWARMLDPFLAAESEARLERRWEELSKKEQADYIRHAVAREVLLLRGPRPVQRAATRAAVRTKKEQQPRASRAVSLLPPPWADDLRKQSERDPVYRYQAEKAQRQHRRVGPGK